MAEKYCLQMVPCGDGCGGNNGNEGNSVPGAENVYSTEETICGTWIDGKPIYRKVITGKLAAAVGTGIVFANVAALNVEAMLNIQGYFVTQSSYGMLQTLYDHSAAAASVCMYYYSTTKEVQYHLRNSGKGYFGCPVTVVLEYTKQES